MSEGRCPRPKLRERIRPKPARSSSRTRILVRFPFSMCSSGKVQAHYLKLWVALEIRIRTLKELVNEPICAEWAMQYQYSPLGCLTVHSAAHNGMINNKLATAAGPAFTSGPTRILAGGLVLRVRNSLHHSGDRTPTDAPTPRGVLNFCT